MPVGVYQLNPLLRPHAVARSERFMEKKGVRSNV
jgi:hypothetical protein